MTLLLGAYFRHISQHYLHNGLRHCQCMCWLPAWIPLMLVLRGSPIPLYPKFLGDGIFCLFFCVIFATKFNVPMLKKRTRWPPQYSSFSTTCPIIVEKLKKWHVIIHNLSPNFFCIPDDSLFKQMEWSTVVPHLWFFMTCSKTAQVIDDKKYSLTQSIYVQCIWQTVRLDFLAALFVAAGWTNCIAVKKRHLDCPDELPEPLGSFCFSRVNSLKYCVRMCAHFFVTSTTDSIAFQLLLLTKQIKKHSMSTCKIQISRKKHLMYIVYVKMLTTIQSTELMVKCLVKHTMIYS